MGDRQGSLSHYIRAIKKEKTIRWDLTQHFSVFIPVFGESYVTSQRRMGPKADPVAKQRFFAKLS